MSNIIIYMKSYFKKLRNIKGFTLIELLVVIGILGILAAALIATIDPFEQLKKGRDTTTRNTALEYLNALTRYYATHGAFPWDVGVTGCTAPTANPAPLLSASSVSPCTLALEAEGELKSGFNTAIGNSGVDDLVRVQTTAAAASNVSLCFSPTSKSIKADASTQYSSACNGVISSACDTLAERQVAADGVCWQLFR